MKMPVLAFFFAVLLLQSSTAEEISKAASARLIKDFNSNWSFNYFPSEKPASGCELPAFDDSKWKAVSLPHTWNTYETTGLARAETDVSGDNYWNSGWGWYRKHFRTGPEITGKKVFLEFDGVQSYCKVWLNGKLLGEHSGGYGRFDFDITSFLRHDADNVIAVSVRNKIQGSSYNLYGGIHRDVSISIKNQLYIPMQGSGSHEGGTSISTFDVSRTQGSVLVQTWVKNDNPSPRVCILQTNIKDKSGKIVQSLKSTAEIKPGEVYRFSQVSKTIKDPHLWSPGTPYMYSVVSEIYEGKSLTDCFVSSFGFRWYEQKSDGLYVNGEKISLSEWTVPADYPFLGSIIPEDLFKELINEIQRDRRDPVLLTSDYPLQEYVYGLADENGILAIESIPADSGDDQKSGINHQLTSEVIRRDRNHPSVLFWRLEDGSVNESYNIIRGEDPGRLVISGNGVQSLVSQRAPVTSPAGKPDAKTIKAARVELKATNDRIVAGRGSVAKIDVIITGEDGSTFTGDFPALKWTISGPAKLVGPSVFNTDDKTLPGKERFNFIRSTGESGRITVKVYAAGLQSGELRLAASEAISSDEGIIELPVKPVIKEANNTETEISPGEIKPVTQELIFSNKNGYVEEVRKYISGNNNLNDTSSAEFRALTSVLCSYLLTSGGKISADDYNFNTGHYNICIRILKYILATKLPPLFKSGLREYYSDYIIRAGNEKDAEQEMNWLNWIPSGGTVIYYQKAKGSAQAEGIISRNSDLAGLISEVHPGFYKFSDDAKTRAIEFITRMNPYVHTSEGSSAPFAEEGKAVLIPLLKYISE